MPSKDFKQGSEFITVYDKKTGAKAFVSINSRVRGKAAGGIRILPDVSETEILELGQTMTKKYGFLGIPMGGAKAGIRTSLVRGNPERLLALKAIGKKLSATLQSKAFIPGFDMGIDFEDLKAILEGAGMAANPNDWKNVTHIFTAWTMEAAAKEALALRHETLEGKTVVIEGFGNVGSQFGRSVGQGGATIIAFSNAFGAVFNKDGFDAETLCESFEKKGDAFIHGIEGAERISKEKLIEIKCDIFAPCARFNPIAEKNADRLGSKIVCSGHNMPLESGAKKILSEKKIIYIPGFIANSGGVLGAQLTEFFEPDEIKRIIDTGFRKKARECFELAARNNASIEDVGIGLAKKQFEKAKKREENKTLVDRAVTFAIGQLPKRVKKEIIRRKLEKLDFN